MKNPFKKTAPAEHVHAWKAVRFTETTETRSVGGFLAPASSVEMHGTRVGFECQVDGCLERALKLVSLPEKEARWLGRADEEVTVPTAFVQAFWDNSDRSDV